MANGGAVCNATLATTESWKDKQSGEQKDKTEWHKVACDLIYEGLREKFLQDTTAADFLVSTGTRTIVECNPTDWFWGAGINLRHPDRENEASHKGENHMGKVLMRIRSDLTGELEQELE